MKKTAVLILLLLCFMAAAALAEPAQEVTQSCQVTYSGKGLNWKCLSDGNLDSSWKSRSAKQQILTFQMPEGVMGGGVYLTFREALPQDVSWTVQTLGEDGEWHDGQRGQLAYLNTFIPAEGETFRVVFEKDKGFALNIREAVVYSQGELPAQVQVWQTPQEPQALVILSGCGTQGIPAALWDMEDPAKTVVAVMTQTRNHQTLDLLSELWSQGVVNYPQQGTFRATTNAKASKVTSAWKEKRIDTFLTELYRSLKPLRVYAPGQNSAGADGAVGQGVLRSAPLAGNLAWAAKSSEKYGLHVPDEVYVLEGEDVRLGETLDSDAIIAQQMLADLGQVQRPDLTAFDLPQRNEEGYLREGTFVLADDEAGVWVYLSEELQVSILRCFAPEVPLTWYEADIQMRGETSWENVFYKEGTQLAQMPHAIAQENHLVFAVNTDNYHLRYAIGERTGVIIRDGQLLVDQKGGTPKNSFPPMETLMLDEDGVFSVYESQEYTAEEYLNMGAYQVYSFGPYLIKDGEFRILTKRFYQNREPRIAIGMVEPGHYCAVLVEGRLKGRSKGCDLMTMGKLLYAKGCTQASNLDGGHSGVMCFMGEQINKIGTYSGKGFSSARTTTELLSVGRYE
ncbi:MAG: phosphodiester glycosidase family protein [Clostridia bacterium]|nr:phosphodiester glycosidase family protein [Clostridia bacterium]